MPDTDIKRHANGSIDTAYYMAKGRQAHSDEAYHLADCTRAAAHRRVSLLREAAKGIFAIRRLGEV